MLQTSVGTGVRKCLSDTALLPELSPRRQPSPRPTVDPESWPNGIIASVCPVHRDAVDKHRAATRNNQSSKLTEVYYRAVSQSRRASEIQPSKCCKKDRMCRNLPPIAHNMRGQAGAKPRQDHSGHQSKDDSRMPHPWPPSKATRSPDSGPPQRHNRQTTRAAHLPALNARNRLDLQAPKYRRHVAAAEPCRHVQDFGGARRLADDEGAYKNSTIRP